MRIFSLLTFIITVSVCLPCAVAVPTDTTISEVPFTFEKGHVVIQAKIKSDITVEMILATGAEHSFIDFGMLDKYKLPAYYTADGPVTGNFDRTYSFSSVPNISVGNAKETSLSMRLISLQTLSARIGRQIFGVLGSDFFKGRIVQFDFLKRVVRFLPEFRKRKQQARARKARA